MIIRVKSCISKPDYPFTRLTELPSQTDWSTLEPTPFSEAVQSSHWQQGMNEEYSALFHNHTWDLVTSSSAHTLVSIK